MPQQAVLDFTPSSRPLPPVVDQRVQKERRRALSGMSLLIWERLQEGPATNAQLAAMFPPGAAWRTRVSDLRRWLEARGQTVEATEIAPGLWRYAARALVLLLALLCVPTSTWADTAKRPSYTPGFVWAVVPVGVDYAMTSRCISQHTCVEANTAGATRAWTTAAMVSSVFVQAHVDRSLRERHSTTWLWLMRGACAGFHGYLAVRAYRVDQKGTRK